MINSIGSEIFNSKFEIQNKQFTGKELVVTLIEHRNSVIFQYLIFKSEYTNHYTIVGFNFKNESIIPVYQNEIKSISNQITTFMRSSYNTIDLDIEGIEESLEYLSNIKIKSADKHTNGNISILMSKGRSVLSCSVKLRNNNFEYKPVSSYLFLNSSGLLYGEIKFDLRNNSNIKKFRLMNDVIIEYTIGNDKIDVSGKIYKAYSTENNSYNIEISSFIYELNNSTLGYYSSKGLNIHSQVNSLLRNAGLKKEQIKIDLKEVGKAPYVVTIPILDLAIGNITFGIGDVQFYSKENLLFKNSDIKNLYNETEHGDFSAFAHTIIEAEDTYDAYEKGINKIQQVLDLITITSKNDRIYNVYNLGNKFNSWTRSNTYKIPTCSTFYYVENLVSNEKVFSDTRNTKIDNLFLIDLDFDEKIKELNWIEEKLYKRLIKIESKELKQIFNAIKWLNRSWKATNIEDKIIYTNISLEFLVDKVNIENFLSREIIDEFKNDVKNILKQKEVYDEEIELKIKNKVFSNLSDVPLKIKVKSLIDNLSMPITDHEFDKLWEVRTYRNNLVHGRDNTIVDEDNLLLANFIISELIIYKLSQEGDD